MKLIKGFTVQWDRDHLLLNLVKTEETTHKEHHTVVYEGPRDVHWVHLTGTNVGEEVEVVKIAAE